MAPHVEFTTNLPLLQLCMALIVVDADITISSAAKMLKLRPILAADNKRPSLLALHRLPREFSGISTEFLLALHV